MTHQKVFQVRYRNPRNSFEIFWAQDVWEIGASFRFVECRTKTARLLSITIPALMTTITECDRPTWWDVIPTATSEEKSPSIA